MRSRVKATILFSLLGLSLAFNAALAWNLLRGDSGDSACLLDRLELDAEQRQKLAEMRKTMDGKRMAYHERSSALKMELAEAICGDGAGLDDLLQQYSAKQAGMQRAVAAHLRGVKAMLRPAQREQFRSLLKEQMFRGMSFKPGGS